MSYKFILNGVTLPVTPEKIRLNIKNKNQSIELINLGEANILKQAGLTSIDFEFVAPAYQYPYVTNFQDQTYYYSLLEKLKADQKPFLFSILRSKPNGQVMYTTNLQVSLEGYTITESAENGFDVVFAVSLKQYKQYGTQSLSIQENNDGTLTAERKNTRTVTKEIPATYTVKSGDTLWNIAKKELGDGSKYQSIAEKNKLDNPNKIYVGQVLTLQ